MTSQIKYMNIDLAQGNEFKELDRVDFTAATKDIFRASPIVNRCADYHVAINRFYFNFYTPKWIPVLNTGLDQHINCELNEHNTIYTITLESYVNNGSTLQSRSRAYIPHILNTATQRLTLTEQPIDEYAFVNDNESFIEMLNRGMKRAFDGLGTLNGSPTQPRFRSDPDSEKLILELGWAENYVNGSPLDSIIRVYFNHPCLTFLGGFPYNIIVRNGQRADPDGKDILLKIFKDKSYLFPETDLNILTPDGYPDFINPINRKKHVLRIKQRYYSALPAFQAVRIVSSLPVASEDDEKFAANTSDLGSNILTDFQVDTSLRKQDNQIEIYNSGLYDCRPKALQGDNPLQYFNIRIFVLDWRGVARPFKLFTQDQKIELKLTFIPNEMINHYRD